MGTLTRSMPMTERMGVMGFSQLPSAVWAASAGSPLSGRREASAKALGSSAPKLLLLLLPTLVRSMTGFCCCLLVWLSSASAALADQHAASQHIHCV